MTLQEGIVSVLAVLGAAFVLIAGLGVWRFKDVYMRMHAATKAGTLGLGFLLAAAGAAEPSLEILIKAGAVIVFIFLTAPVAAHMLSRAAYLMKSELSPGTRQDALLGKYDREKGLLE